MPTSKRGRFTVKGLQLFNHQSAVLRAEANAIAKRDAHIRFAREIGNVIEVAIRIGFVEIDCGRDQIGMHRAEGCTQARRAAGPLRVSDL